MSERPLSGNDQFVIENVVKRLLRKDAPIHTNSNKKFLAAYFESLDSEDKTRARRAFVNVFVAEARIGKMRAFETHLEFLTTDEITAICTILISYFVDYGKARKAVKVAMMLARKLNSVEIAHCRKAACGAGRREDFIVACNLSLTAPTEEEIQHLLSTGIMRGDSSVIEWYLSLPGLRRITEEHRIHLFENAILNDRFLDAEKVDLAFHVRKPTLNMK